MNNFSNGDLYTIVLNRLRKDRKGSISPEEFESFLRYRNTDYFNQQMGEEGVSKINEESLRPFMEQWDPLGIAQDANSLLYWAPFVSMTHFAEFISLFYTTKQAIGGAVPEINTGMVECDIIQRAELPDRLSNAITGPSVTNPVCYTEDTRIYIFGISSTTGTLLANYYKIPTDPYFDYYTDAAGNITYLTDGQAAYTLLAGEVARDGSIAGAAVTSDSEDLAWSDQDAMNILDMVMTDIGVAQGDQDVAQSSVLERQQNVRV